MNRGTLRDAALSGGKWSVIEAIGVQLLSMATTLVLARFLVDDDFAIVAIVATVTGFLSLASAAGFGASVVQRAQVSADDVATTFWTALGAGAVLAALAAIFAQPIATVLDHVDAAGFIAVGGLALLFGLPASVARGMLYRNFRQRAVTNVTLLANVVFAAFALGMTTIGDLGVWALIIAQVIRPAVLLVGFMVAARWFPPWRFTWLTLRSDLAFNTGYLGGTVGMYLVKNIDYWFVARALPDGSLGVYYLAYVLPTIVRQRMTWAIDRSLLPVMSRLRDDRARLAAAYLRVLRLVSLIAVPAMVGMSVIAADIVPIAFGQGWEGVAAPLALLALAAAADALWQAASTLLVADGTPGTAIPVVILRLAVLIGGLALATRSGDLTTVASAVLVASLVGAAAGLVVAVRRLPVTVRDLANAIGPTVLPTALMAVTASLIAHVVDVTWLALITAVTAGVVVYVVTGLLVHREAFRQLITDGRGLVRGGSAIAPTES